MTSVTNPELSQHLHEVSGWDLGNDDYVWVTVGSSRQALFLRRELVRTSGTINPELTLTNAYDLGYMLRKMSEGYIIVTPFNDEWLASWAPRADADDYAELAATPEDAAGLLVIRLFKEGVLTR